MGLIQERSTVPALVRALGDRSATVRREAAFALGLMGDTTVVSALGTRWEHEPDTCGVVDRLRADGYEIAAVETSVKSVDLFDWEPAFPVSLIFGNEVDGVRPELSARADTYVRIPMLGVKHSLNVATAGGIVIYELLRKYRRLALGTRGLASMATKSPAR